MQRPAATPQQTTLPSRRPPSQPDAERDLQHQNAGMLRRPQPIAATMGEMPQLAASLQPTAASWGYFSTPASTLQPLAALCRWQHLYAAPHLTTGPTGRLYWQQLLAAAPTKQPIAAPVPAEVPATPHYQRHYAAPPKAPPDQGSGLAAANERSRVHSPALQVSAHHLAPTYPRLYQPWQSATAYPIIYRLSSQSRGAHPLPSR